MRILTIAMQVPDSRATVKVAPGGADIVKQGLKLVCNPFDEFAVEQALRIREARQDVEEVVALTVGGPDAVQTLRTALAMGADRAIHVCDEQVPAHDELWLAESAAAALRHDEHEFELVLCGKQAIDNDSGELGPALAEYLGWPHIGAVTWLELSDDGTTLRAHRRIEGAEEVLEAALPLLITCEKGLVEPRYPPLPALIKAKKKPVQTVALAELPALAGRTSATTLVELSPPPSRSACTMIEGEPEEMARELVRLLREEAKVV